MTEPMNREVALREGAHELEEPVATSPSFEIPSNKYSDLFGLWPPELFEGFEEFVKQSRIESGYGREPPPWW